MNPLGALKLILCSASPRRRQLLQGLGLEVEITSVDIDETPDPATPLEAIAEEIAVRKADAWPGSLSEQEVLLTADTVVLLEDRTLAKPTDAEEAREMLRQLSGKTHAVITGVCLRSGTRSVSFSDTTSVRFKALSEEEIAYYVEAHKPFDKAGSYGVQEWIGYIAVEHMSGSFYTVMGLPMHRVYAELQAFKLD